MSDVDARIREAITELLLEKQKDSRRFKKFASETDLDLAVFLIRKRFENLVAMGKHLSRKEELSAASVDRLIAFVSEKRSKGIQENMNYPQNDIGLSSFIPPLSASGLCPLPSRVDCLTAPCTVYPGHVPESDLSLSELPVEEIDVKVNEKTDEPRFLQVGVVRKVRIKKIS